MFRGIKKTLKMLIFIIIILAGVYLAINIKYPKSYSEIVQKYAQEYNVDKNIIFSIIDKESKFNPKAVSEKGAIGLMQIMPATAEEICIELGIENIDLYNPDDNIKIGAYYVKKLMNKYNDKLHICLAAYNAGMGNVSNWNNHDDANIYAEEIPIKETKDYVKDVLKNYKMYSTIYDKYKIPPIDIKDEHISVFHNVRDFFKYIKKKAKLIYEKI